MTNREKLLQMYDFALSNALCHNRKGFAELIGISPNNLSNALSEKLCEKFCTESLLDKAKIAIGMEEPTPEPSPLPLAEDTQKISDSRDELIEQLKAELEQQKEFNALQREYVADLKERISEYQERVAELKELIHELKKAQHDASAHRVKNA
jgi:hypothetical protein